MKRLIIFLLVLLLYSCSSTEKVTTNDRRESHTESTIDSIASIGRQEHHTSASVKQVDSLLERLYHEYRTHTSDSVIIREHADGSCDIISRSVRRDSIIVRDTLWRTRWRDSVRVDSFIKIDSITVKHLCSRTDSLEQVIAEKETIIKKQGFFDRLRQYIMGGITALFLLAILFLWLKFKK